MRLFPNRRYFFLIITSFVLVTLLHLVNKSSPRQSIRRPNEVQSLLSQLFHPSSRLIDQQISWNKLLKIWKNILVKFLDNGCDLCHENDDRCLQSIDINQYIHWINKTFYPMDKTRQIRGMGLYYQFDLLFIQTMNNSILWNEKTMCDYFHMLQLLIHVQIIFHQNHIEYFITKGTLIGSLRHHDLIPWDTDIDLFISHLSIPLLVKSIKQLDDQIQTTTPSTDRLEEDSIFFHPKVCLSL